QDVWLGSGLRHEARVDDGGRARSRAGWPGTSHVRQRPVNPLLLIESATDWMIRRHSTCHSGVVHLLPAERSGHRVIDEERVCQAIAAVGPAEGIQARARAFAILGDPTR